MRPVFNYDIFALNVARNPSATHRHGSAEYRPRWSPDGKTLVYQATRRGLTDLETTMRNARLARLRRRATRARL